MVLNRQRCIFKNGRPASLIWLMSFKAVGANCMADYALASNRYILDKLTATPIRGFGGVCEKWNQRAKLGWQLSAKEIRP